MTIILQKTQSPECGRHYPDQSGFFISHNPNQTYDILTKLTKLLCGKYFT